MRPLIRGSAELAGRPSRTPGALIRKQMESIDDETTNAAVDFIKRQTQANKPFSCWWNATRMHLCTHVRPEYRTAAG